jgi:hypothetical protein
VQVIDRAHRGIGKSCAEVTFGLFDQAAYISELRGGLRQYGKGQSLLLFDDIYFALGTLNTRLLRQ